MSNQSPYNAVQVQPQMLNANEPTQKKKKKKGHPLLHKLGHAAEEVGSATVTTAGVAARVGMTGMMYAMRYGYGYGGYGYMPYMGYGMMSPLMYGRL